MGTRHLIAVQLDGKYRIAQYGQWDGYPSGQGETVLDFLRTWNRQQFEERLRAASFMTEEDDRAVEALGENWKKKGWGHLSRDLGAEILEHVQNAPSGIKLQNQLEFAADSLFCEWAYVIDLDKNTLEVFKGFNKTPLEEGERFAGLAVPSEDHRNKEYLQCKLAKSYPLDALPSLEQLCADCDPADEEEEAA